MKTYIIFILLLIVSLKSQSQSAIAGIAGANYTDIDPDVYLYPTMNYSQQTLLIDLNQDGVNDVKIETSTFSSPGGMSLNTAVVSQNNHTQFALGSIDSTIIPPYGSSIRKVLKKYNSGDTISSNNFVLTSSGYIGYYYSSGGLTAGSYQWVNAGDKYVGVVYTDSTQTLYGWIKVNVTGSNFCYVKEYSLCSASVGLEKEMEENDNLTIWPNPASSFFLLQSSQTFFTGKPVLYDNSGKQVSAEMIYVNENTYKVDVSQLQAGIYFIYVLSDRGYLRKKVINSK